jgi:hypothetical protein
VTAFLDTIQLVLAWEPPALRPIRSTDSTYHGGAANPLLATDGSSNHSLYIMGTTYLPSASINMTLNNASTEVFRSGLVLWSGTLDINPSNSYQDAVIEVPDMTLDYSDVYFTAWICGTGAAPTTAAAAASSCTRAGTARASFQDNDPASVSTSGVRKVKVYSWTIYR